jgi:hypothetical protein
VAQDGAGELGEEPLDEVEPGAVLGREGKFEAAYGSCIEPGSGFSRDVCGMIIEDQLDRRAGRIGGIEKLGWTPGTGGKSGAVVAIAWIPGFSS